MYSMKTQNKANPVVGVLSQDIALSDELGPSSCSVKRFHVARVKHWATENFRIEKCVSGKFKFII